MLIGIRDEGPLMGGLGVRLDTPSEVLLILAIAPCTQAFICVFPLELVVPFSPPEKCYLCLYLICKIKNKDNVDSQGNENIQGRRIDNFVTIKRKRPKSLLLCRSSVKALEV